MPLPDNAAQVEPAARKTMIELPGSDASDDAVHEILARGNIPLLVGDKILAEIASNELGEGLAATENLTNAELSSICNDLAESINDALISGSAACDVVEVAADAAALFILCLRRHDILDVDNLPACSISFDSADNGARLTLAG